MQTANAVGYILRSTENDSKGLTISTERWFYKLEDAHEAVFTAYKAELFKRGVRNISDAIKKSMLLFLACGSKTFSWSITPQFS